MRKVSLGIAFVVFSLASHAQVEPTEANLRAAAASGGVTKFSASGTISLTTPVEFSAATTLDADGHVVVIDGQNLTPLLNVNAAGNLTLKGLTLINGRSQGVDSLVLGGPSAGPAMGGAIRNFGGVVSIVSCVFSNNHAIGGSGFSAGLLDFRYANNGGAASGGAIYQTAGALIIDNSSFLANSARAGVGSGPAPGYGGAIASLAGSVTIGASTFLTNSANAGSNNSLHGNSEAHGGAIYVETGSLTVSSNRFGGNSILGIDNSPAYGGAIGVKSGGLLVSDSLFNANAAIGGAGMFYRSSIGSIPGQSAYGGAININSNVSAQIHNSAFLSNTVTGGARFYNSLASAGNAYGGAICVMGTADIVNSTIVGNGAFFNHIPDIWLPPSPDRFGAAIYSSGAVAATNITVGDNTSHGAILTVASGTFILKNSLLANTLGGTGGPGITDAGNNLSLDESPVFTQPSSQNNVPNLKLGPLGDYGGPTPTILLMAGSPAINTADDAAAPPTDQRGHARPFGAHADIGAFESSPPFHVFGQLHGFRDSMISVVVDEVTTQPATDGSFRRVVSNGSHTFTFVSPDSITRPNPLTVDVTADMAIEARVFAFDALAYDPDLDMPAFTLAGSAGQTWEFQVSNDLVLWTPVQTNTFAADGIASYRLTNPQAPIFMRAKRQ